MSRQYTCFSMNHIEICWGFKVFLTHLVCKYFWSLSKFGWHLLAEVICRVGYENARRQPLAISTLRPQHTYQKRTFLVRTKLCKCFFMQHFHLCRFNPFDSLFSFSRATAAVEYNMCEIIEHLTG